MIRAAYIGSSGMLVFVARVPYEDLKIMFLQTSNTPGRITTFIWCLAMPTHRQPMANSKWAIAKNSVIFDIFPVGWAISWHRTSQLQCRSAGLTACKRSISLARQCSNPSTCKLQPVHLYLLTTTSLLRGCYPASHYTSVKLPLGHTAVDPIPYNESS